MLPRAGVRTLRSIHIQPSAKVYIPSRTYAKAGRPKPPEFKHVASTVATPKKATTQATDHTYKPDTPLKFSKNGTSTPNPQAKLDSKAPEAVPAGTEAKSIPIVEEPVENDQAFTQGKVPLHDITKGIPSTLDAELREAARRQRKADNPEEAEPEVEEPATSTGSGGGRGDRPVRDYTTSTERRRNRLMGWLTGSIVLLLFTGPVYLGRNWEDEEEIKRHPDAPNGWGIQLFINRVRARMSTTLDYYNEPAFPKLLPDVDPQFEKPYTLVLSLEDLLVHGGWTREHGWRIAKRPGLDYFLRYLQPYYEIVIFTSAPSMVGVPVLMKLDPFGIVPWRLFREATRYKDGKHIKVSSFPQIIKPRI